MPWISLTRAVLRNITRNELRKSGPAMRSVSSAEAARNFSTILASLLAPGAEPVAVTHDNIPQVVVMSFKDYQDLIRQTRFAGRLADLPEGDLAFVSTVDERNT